MKGLSTEFANLRSIKEVIKEFRIDPKKSMGQNFLTNSFITDNIVLSAGDISDSMVIEVGSGPGILTRSILSSGVKQLIAIEMDDRCVKALSELKSIAGDRLEILNQDALRVDWSTLLTEDTSIIANLPYNIATALLQIWLASNSIKQIIVMIQKEVAERFSASQGEEGYSALSILTKSRWDAEILFDVDAHEFFPPPKVVSSVIRFTPSDSKIDNALYKKLQHLLKISFAQRRKLLRSALKKSFSNYEYAMQHVGADMDARAEDLTAKQYIDMASILL